MCVAFPLLRSLGEAPRLTCVDPSALLATRRLLFGDAPHPLPDAPNVLECSFRAGAGLSIPVSFIGSSAACGAEAVLAHIPGLPGAVPVALSALRRHRRLFRAAPAEDAEGDALWCALEAVGRNHSAREVLDGLLAAARRRLAELRGMEVLLTASDRIRAAALRRSFAYHAGATHATRRFFDVSAEACGVFGGVIHGAKLLSRYGAAVVVGVAPDEAVGGAALFVHPFGAPAACVAPAWSGCPVLRVGDLRLEGGGPVPGAAPFVSEDPARYMDPSIDGEYDGTTWLNEGLFGVRPGDRIGQDIVHGVRYNAHLREFELHVRDPESGEVGLCTECLLL